MTRKIAPRSASGFSLVELMVAIVVAIVATLAVLQVYSTTEERRRTTGGVAGAQTSGTLANYLIDRELRLAGYGFGDAAQMGCAVTAYDSVRGSASDFNFPLVPVFITVGTGASGDTVAVLYGTSDLKTATLQFTASSATTKKTRNRTGVLMGDVIVATASGTPDLCAMQEITGNLNSDALTVDHTTSAYTTEAGVAKTPRYNKSGGIGVTFTQGNLLDLGVAPRRSMFRVENDRLVVRDDLRFTDNDGDGINDAVALAENIVSLKAQYWRDVNGDGTVDSTEWITDTTAWTPVEWRQVVGVRIGILARSGQYDKTLESANPSWAGGDFVMVNLDGSAGTTDPDSPNNWRRYRYRVYESVVPLRNVIWGNSP